MTTRIEKSVFISASFINKFAAASAMRRSDSYRVQDIVYFDIHEIQ